MEKRFKLWVFVLLLIFFLIIDVSGYMLIERVNIADALYMTVISITTVGFKEVFPLSETGRFFTIFVIISGLGVFFYAAVAVAEHNIENRIRKILGRRKMRTLSKMKDHIIIVGFGRMGEIVSRQLTERKVTFVIIEKDPERFKVAEEYGYNIILSDATNEEVLQEAGIGRARAFISLLASDAENIFTVLTARELNPAIFIVSRALNIINEKKLYKIGADRVVTPQEISSRRIVNTVLKPNVVNLIDIVTHSRDMALSLEEITIAETSSLVGKTIRDSGIRKDFDAIVVAVKRENKLFFNPSPDLTIKARDLLILIGEREKLLKVT